MTNEISQKQALLYRTVLALVMIAIAAALRIAPHLWNFTPVGAMALFSGAVLKDRRLAFAVPLVALFAGDLVVGFYKIQLMLVVYGCFLLSVAIGLCLRNRRTIGPISLAILLGAFQFFVISDFAFWVFGTSYAYTREGLIACYVGAIPFLFNMLAGDVLYAALLFGGFALAERTFPAFREHASAAAE